MSAPRIYPWDEWTDGQAREVIQGTDFEIRPANMARAIRAYARSHGMSATASVIGDKVEFQFFS